MNDIEKIIKIVIVFTFGFGLMIVVATAKHMSDTVKQYKDSNKSES